MSVHCLRDVTLALDMRASALVQAVEMGSLQKAMADIPLVTPDTAPDDQGLELYNGKYPYLTVKQSQIGGDIG